MSEKVEEKQSEKAALESLVVENPDLDRLEILLEQFNIFEALDAVHVEIRHSAYLAYLLNPSESHGLGDLFVKRFLKQTIFSYPQQSLEVSSIEVDVWDLSNVLVLREWENIDILLVDEIHKFVVIIENKIKSSEHSNQLTRYWKNVSNHYRNWRKIGIFLTPEGDIPTNDMYIPVNYTTVCEILEQIIANRSTSMGADVLMSMRHYSQMLRRHIVSESEIAELCQRIYHKHKKAMDLILEHRPDHQAMILEIVKGLIKERKEFILDHTSKSYIRFGVKDWDAPILMQGKGWTRSGRILLFEFDNLEDRLTLYLIIGPGPDDTRNRLFALAKENKPPFKASARTMGKYWSSIYKLPILEESSYEGAVKDEIETEIKKKWSQFMEHGFVEINTIIKREKWLFQPSDAIKS